jgi:hypothetical protein
MTGAGKKSGVLRYCIATGILVILLGAFGCVSTVDTAGTANVGFKATRAPEAPGRVLERRDLDHVIGAKLSRAAMTAYFNKIAIENYSIQDPNTNWSHASIGGADSAYSVYYLTYQHRYFILLLVDVGDRFANCVDVVSGPMPAQYELGMGPVEINHDRRDPRVVVIFNRNWNGDYSDDITAAFKLNLESRHIDAFKASYIRIFRQD